LLDKELQKLLLPTITALGYELVGVERLSQGGHRTLIRVYIDSPAGIHLSDCEQVSHQVSGLLDVQDPIPGHYVLEISSPGLERPLFTLEHFIRFIGCKVSVRLNRPVVATQRNFTGLLQQVQGHNIIMVVEDTEYSLPYEQIEKAHLVPDS
jgi:ribosome maturation factor RimP